MKKVVSSLFVLVMGASLLVGCGSKEAEKTVEKTAEGKGRIPHLRRKDKGSQAENESYRRGVHL